MKTFCLGVLSIGLLHAGSITVIDLGGFGGASGIGYRINDAGVVVGWAQTVAGDNHAFVTSGNGVLKDLNGSTASESLAYGVNNTGSVVGTSYSGGQAHGTIWTSAGATDLGAGTYALDINSSGQVAGGNGQAFLYSNGATQSLGVLPTGNWSSAYAISDTGAVAGYGNVAGGSFRGFVWTSASGLQQLGTLGGNNSYAMAINNSGQVVGHANVASGYDHAFVTSGKALVDLGTLGGVSSYAYGINTQGAIVGYSWLPGSSDQHAFLYYNGQMQDLNSLIPASSGWVLQQAFGINDEGDIVGSGTFNGQTRAFLIDPIPLGAPLSTPEPGTITMLAAGLSAIILFRKGRMPS